MKAARRFLCFILILVIAFSSFGCWDYNETEDLLFVIGMSLDRAESGRLLGVLEIAAVKPQGQAVSPEYIEVEGDTFHDVMYNADKISDKQVNWSHILAVIVSQDVARNDMTGLMDMMIRMRLVHVSLVIAVSKEATAREVMLAQNPAKELNSFNLVGSLNAERQLGKAPYIQLYQFADAVADERESAVLPAVGLADTSMGKMVEISGMAVFRGPWLQGFMDEYDTRALLMLQYGKNLFNMPLPADPGRKFTSAGIELQLKRVDILPSFENGKASVDIYIRGEVVPMEISGASTDPSKFKTVADAIQVAACTALENSITGMLRRTQQMGGCDIVGIGSRLKDRQPDVWRAINGQWREYYINMDIHVRAGLTIKSSGQQIQPITKGN